MKFIIANASGLVTDDECRSIAAAVQAQLDFDFCPLWRLLTTQVRFMGDLEEPWADDVIVTLFDAPDVDGALGYHDEVKGAIEAKIFVQPVLDAGGSVFCGSTKASPNTVSAVVSHEILETMADLYASFWADGSGLAGWRSTALEVADPVQERAYGIEVNVAGATRIISVSDFVLPSWFDAQAKPGTRLSYLKDGPTEPFGLSPGGYLIVRTDGGVERQVFGELAAWRAEAKHPERRRSARRLVSQPTPVRWTDKPTPERIEASRAKHDGFLWQWDACACPQCDADRAKRDAEREKKP